MCSVLHDSARRPAGTNRKYSDLNDMPISGLQGVESVEPHSGAGVSEFPTTDSSFSGAFGPESQEIRRSEGESASPPSGDGEHCSPDEWDPGCGLKTDRGQPPSPERDREGAFLTFRSFLESNIGSFDVHLYLSLYLQTMDLAFLGYEKGGASPKEVLDACIDCS